MGAAKNDLSDPEGAFEAYDEALKLDENIELALRYKAENIGVYGGEEVLNLYNRLIKFYPENMYYYFKRSEVRGVLGDNEGKLKDRIKTLELAKQQNLWNRSPSSSDDPVNKIRLGIYSIIGNNYYELGDIPKACDYWNIAYESGWDKFFFTSTGEYMDPRQRGQKDFFANDPKDNHLKQFFGGGVELEDIIYKVCL